MAAIDDVEVLNMNNQLSLWLRIGAWALLGLNAAFVTLFVLWRLADAAAVNRAESAGFDPSMLLPNGNLMWLAAHASLFCLIAVDVCAIGAFRSARVARLTSPL